MKKTFFLDLDHAGVRLRHGAGSEYPVIGEVALDDPHFETRLEDLRRDAEALSDGPLETALTIPASEILFTTVEMDEGAGDDAARTARIEAELEGMTPYALDELAYTWNATSTSEIAVAAVARETLAEAERFAAAHGFNPRSFTAEPREGLFRERPDFGATSHSETAPEAAAPPEAEPVTRIADLLSDAPPARASSPDASEGADVDTAETPPGPALTDAADALSETAPETALRPTDPTAPETGPLPTSNSPEPAKVAPRPTPAPAPAMADQSADAAPRDRPAPAADASPRAPAATMPSATDEVKEPATSATGPSRPAPATAAGKPAAARRDGPATPDTSASQTATLATDAGPAAPPDDAEAPPPADPAGPPLRATPDARAADGTDAAQDTPPPPGDAPAILPDRDPAETPARPSRISIVRSEREMPDEAEERTPVALAGPGFASRRMAADGTPPHESAGGASRLGSIASRIAALPDGGTAPAAASAGVATLKAPAATGTGRPQPGPRSSPTPSVRRISPPAGATAASLAPRPANAAPANDAPEAAAAPRDEADQMTVFGARHPGGARAGGSILPVIIGLLVALAIAIGVWGAFFLLTPTDEVLLGQEDNVAALPDDTAESPGPIVPDAAAPETADDSDVAPPVFSDPAPGIVDEPVPPAPGGTDPILAAPDVDAGAAPAANDPLRRPEGAPEAGRYAATGIAADPPARPDAPETDRVDELRTATGDVDLRAQDGVAAIAVPDPAGDAPDALMPPPPPGESFELDPDGRVVATEDGAISPQGILVTAGPPAVTPPATPDRPATAQVRTVGEADVVVPVNEGTPDIRPRQRPADLPTPEDEARAADPEGSPISGEPAARIAAGPDATPGDTPVSGNGAQTLADANPLESGAADAPAGDAAPALTGATDAAVAAALGDAGPSALPADTDEATETASATADVLREIAALRPLPRPERPAPPAAADAVDAALRPALPPVTPLARPASVEARVAALAADAAGETGSAAASAAAAALAGLVPARPAPVAGNPSAVARSLAPQTRPGDLPTATRQEPARVAAAAAIARPSGPTSGTVASRATVSNAIRLGQVNLMGVYGSESNRRALVRLPSGRFEKVKVGDRVDGGRVRAIGDGQLSYVKGGRQITLTMPRG